MQCLEGAGLKRIRVEDTRIGSKETLPDMWMIDIPRLIMSLFFERRRAHCRGLSDKEHVEGVGSIEVETFFLRSTS